MLTRRCFPMVLVWPFLASACRSAHRLHLPRIGNLFHADFRFAPSRLEQHSIASRATLETPIHEGMGAHGLRGRVPYCACCYQSLDCLCLNGRHFRSITSERPLCHLPLGGPHRTRVPLPLREPMPPCGKLPSEG